ncbi:hypothetical protein LINGRAPRIM_LOCUS2795, partial [Linum grandiflorum]
TSDHNKDLSGGFCCQFRCLHHHPCRVARCCAWTSYCLGFRILEDQCSS